MKKEKLHIYIRCSTDKQIDNSVDRQKSMGVKFSEKMGMDYKLWVDGGKSRFGGMDKRESITELMDELELGLVKHIWVEDWSRLTGEIDDTFTIEKKIIENDVVIYEGLRGNSPYQPDNKMEKMYQYMKTIMSSEIKKDEIKKSIKTKIDLFNQGYYMKGDSPFGYKLVDRKLVVDRNESKWVKKIFDMYVNDKMSYSQIRDELILNDVRTKRKNNRVFGDENIRIILTNRNYIGEDYYTDKTKDKHRLNPKRYPFPDESCWVIHKGTCPRIIDDETFNKVGKFMTRNKSRVTKRNYLLHGKIKCDCGNDWSGRWYHKYEKHFYHCINNERRYYRNTPNREHLHSSECNKPQRIDGQKLEHYVWNNLMETLDKSTWLKERVKREILGEKYGISSMRKRLNSDMNSVNKEIKIFKKNRTQFIKDRYLNNLNELEYDDILTSIDDKLVECNQRLEGLKNKETLMDKRTQWIDWLQHHNENVEDYKKITDLRGRRRVVDFYIEEIRLSFNHDTKQHTINIHYKYPMVGDELVRKGGKLNWDKWGNGYKIKQGESVYSLSTDNFFLTKENYQTLLNSCGIGFDSSIPFIKFIFHSVTHKLSSTQFNKPLSVDRDNLHKEIFKYYNQGLGYKRIHKILKTNGWKIGKSPTTVDFIIKKRLKRDRILNQPILEEYRDFDIHLSRIHL